MSSVKFQFNFNKRNDGKLIFLFNECFCYANEYRLINSFIFIVFKNILGMLFAAVNERNEVE